MDFFKKLFNQDVAMVGLCGFNFVKASCKKTRIETDFFFNPFERQRVFETNYMKNNLLL